MRKQRATRHAPPEHRRAQILLAALRCFADKGFHAATMDDLVRASGLSKGSLYWHFRSKEEVFLALFDAFMDDFFADWDAAGASRQPTLEVLRGVGERAVEKLCSQGWLLRAWVGFFAHPQARERLAEVYRRSRGRLAETLRRDIESGAIRDLPADGMAAALLASLEGLFLQAMVDADFDIRAHYAVVWEVVCRGMLRA
jgi:AcrR family transcriptional regulator